MLHIRRKPYDSKFANNGSNPEALQAHNTRKIKEHKIKGA